jgi:hypothetical protein
VGTVSSGSARRGRRDNGLDAAEYAAAGDVDPRIGEHLLDVLALQGIAAYLQPAVDLNPVTRSAVMPARPTDRLFVDRTHLRTARDYLAQLAEPGDTAARGASEPVPLQPDQAGLTGAQPDQVGGAGAQADRPGRHGEPGADEREDEVDDAWAEIVAGYDTEVDATTASWPEAENVSPDRRPYDLEDTEDVSDPEQRPAARPSWEGQPSLLSALDTFGTNLPDEADDEEGYTPPPPPPLPRLSKYAVTGVLAIIAGFILFLKPSLLPIDSDVSMLIGFTAILAGFGMLVWRLRPGDDEDDYDPDDGARV